MFSQYFFLSESCGKKASLQEKLVYPYASLFPIGSGLHQASYLELPQEQPCMCVMTGNLVICQHRRKRRREQGKQIGVTECIRMHMQLFTRPRTDMKGGRYEVNRGVDPYLKQKIPEPGFQESGVDIYKNQAVQVLKFVPK